MDRWIISYYELVYSYSLRQQHVLPIWLLGKYTLTRIHDEECVFKIMFI